MGAKINGKEQAVQMLREEFKRWEELLSGLSEEEISARNLDAGWSIKDVMAHLWAWQQRSLARMEAALSNREPDYPAWLEAFDPDPEADVDQTNAWIYETYRDKPWPGVYADWRSQFLRIVELTEEVPEKDLLQPRRYAWMEGYALSASLEGTYEHHEEHRGWLSERGK